MCGCLTPQQAICEALLAVDWKVWSCSWVKTKKVMRCHEMLANRFRWPSLKPLEQVADLELCVAGSSALLIRDLSWTCHWVSALFPRARHYSLFVHRVFAATHVTNQQEHGAYTRCLDYLTPSAPAQLCFGYEAFPPHSLDSLVLQSRARTNLLLKASGLVYRSRSSVTNRLFVNASWDGFDCNSQLPQSLRSCNLPGPSSNAGHGVITFRRTIESRSDGPVPS